MGLYLEEYYRITINQFSSVWQGCGYEDNVLTRRMMKYLGIKYCHVYTLLSNSLVKIKKQIYIENFK